MSPACGATVNRPRRGLGQHQVGLLAAAAHHPGGVRGAQRGARLGRRDAVRGVCPRSRPGPRRGAPRRRTAARPAGPGPGRRVDRPPPGGRHLHGHVHPGGGFAEVLLGVAAGAVARVPAVHAEPHVRAASRGLGTAAARPRRRPSRTTLEVRASLDTWNRTGTRSASAATWVITPTIRSSWARVSRVVATTSRVSGSSVPNPSSRKIESSRAAPAADEAGHLRGQGQRQRQRGLEGLPAGQRAHGPAGVGVGVVDDVELAVLVGEVELAAGQARQVAGRDRRPGRPRPRSPASAGTGPSGAGRPASWPPAARRARLPTWRPGRPPRRGARRCAWWPRGLRSSAAATARAARRRRWHRARDRSRRRPGPRAAGRSDHRPTERAALDPLPHRDDALVPGRGRAGRPAGQRRPRGQQAGVVQRGRAEHDQRVAGRRQPGAGRGLGALQARPAPARRRRARRGP